MKHFLSRPLFRYSLISVVAVIGLLVYKLVGARLEEKSAEDSVRRVITAWLTGDYATMKELQWGNELELLAITPAELERYRVALFSGYINESARIELKRERLTYSAPTNDYERNMVRKMQETDSRSPTFIVRIFRSDSPEHIQFPLKAVRNQDKWVVSPTAALAWIQMSYSSDDREKYAHILRSLREAKLGGICGPDGVWMRQERIQMFLDGQIGVKEIMK